MESALTAEQKNVLNDAYYDPRKPGSYSGLERFWKYVKDKTDVSKSQVKNWLREQDAYTSFYPKRGRFKRPQTISPGKDVFWQSDTAYMVAFQDSNDNYSFFAVFIDVFSRYVWTRPLKTLKGLEMRSVMDELFQEVKCKNLYTDAGSEYVNRSVSKLLKENDIRHYVARSDTKASLAERVIKTLKKFLFQYLEQNNTH